MPTVSDNQQQREREHFDKLADATGEVWWGSVTPAGIRRLVLRAQWVANDLKRFSDPKVLELGCGTGALTGPVLQVLPSLRLVGCDLSPNSIRIAATRYSKYPNARFDVAGATNLPYQRESFHAVIGNSILHHIPLMDSIRESLRILKPGGVLIF